MRGPRPLRSGGTAGGAAGQAPVQMTLFFRGNDRAWAAAGGMQALTAGAAAGELRPSRHCAGGGITVRAACSRPRLQPCVK